MNNREKMELMLAVEQAFYTWADKKNKRMTKEQIAEAKAAYYASITDMSNERDEDENQ
jgi:hypothetical protein